MGQPRDPFVVEWADTVLALAGQGITDPHAAEIAEATYQGRAIFPELIQGIQERLHRVRDVLEEQSYSVVLLSETYYAEYRDTPPADLSAARLCLPVGNGKKAVGIWFTTDLQGDLIWQAAIKNNQGNANGKQRAQLGRIVTGYEEQRLDLESAVDLALPSQTRLPLPQADIETKVIRRLK